LRETTQAIAFEWKPGLRLGTVYTEAHYFSALQLPSAASA